MHLALPPTREAWQQSPCNREPMLPIECHNLYGRSMKLSWFVVGVGAQRGGHGVWGAQVEAIGRAAVVVAVHGADLMNMAWLPRGASVVEIAPVHSGYGGRTVGASCHPRCTFVSMCLCFCLTFWQQRSHPRRCLSFSCKHFVSSTTRFAVTRSCHQT